MRQKEHCDFKQYTLTKRQKEIVLMLVMGHSIQEIAASLFLSAHTVSNHKKRIYRGLGIKKAVHLGVYAERSGMLVGKKLKPG